MFIQENVISQIFPLEKYILSENKEGRYRVGPLLLPKGSKSYLQTNEGTFCQDGYHKMAISLATAKQVHSP